MNKEEPGDAVVPGLLLLSPQAGQLQAVPCNLSPVTRSSSRYSLFPIPYSLFPIP
jgi:hypothetical protein